MYAHVGLRRPVDVVVGVQKATLLWHDRATLFNESLPLSPASGTPGVETNSELLHRSISYVVTTYASCVVLII